MVDWFGGQIFGLKEVQGNLKKAGVNMGDNTQKKLIELGLEVERKAKEYSPVKTGRLRSSIHMDVVAPMQVLVGTNVRYACGIGSHNNGVYNPITKGTNFLSDIKLTHVLSKDGNSHKVLKRFCFSQAGKNIINGIKIQTSPRRKSIFVTPNHLILTLRDDILQWIQAGKLLPTDLIFKKRSHNAITDNSNKEMFICKNCNKEFWVERSLLKYRSPLYCNNACRHKDSRHDYAKGKRWKLSKETRFKHVGNNNPQWKGGTSKEPYDWRFNKLLKDIVKERDNYMCQGCGAKNKTLVVHHMDFDKKNSNIDNLITLCHSCHGKITTNSFEFELPEVNLTMFKPTKIYGIEKIKYYRKGKKGHLPALYDIQVEKENSFLMGGILVHNSYQEFGSKKNAPHPFMRPALDTVRGRLGSLLKGNIMKS